MRRSVIAAALTVLAVGGLAGCSTDAVTDRVDAAVAERLDTMVPGGLESVCETYRTSGVDADGLVDLLRGQFGDEDVSELLGLPIHVDNDRLLRVIADQVVAACG